MPLQKRTKHKLLENKGIQSYFKVKEQDSTHKIYVRQIGISQIK